MSQHTTDNALSTRTALRSLAPSLILNAVCPFVLYQLLQPHFPQTSVVPLLYVSIFPLFGTVLGLVRQRVVDAIGVLALIEIFVSVAVSFITGSRLLVLLSQSLHTALVGGIYLSTLLFPAPLMFYIARQLVTGNDAEHAKRFDRTLAHPYPRFVYRFLTLVWGLALVGVAVLRVGLAVIAPVSVYLALAPILAYGAYIILIVWSLRYGRQALPRIREHLQQGTQEQFTSTATR